MNKNPTWPEDTDGDVFRALTAKRFDFSIEYDIDFTVDFQVWPPHPESLTWLQSRYSAVEVFEPEDDFGGCVLFKIQARLTYDLVARTQAEVTAQLERFGGLCESWGVLH